MVGVARVELDVLTAGRRGEFEKNDKVKQLLERDADVKLRIDRWVVSLATEQLAAQSDDAAANPALREELLDRMKQDQDAREHARVDASTIDNANEVRLEEIIAKFGRREDVDNVREASEESRSHHEEPRSDADSGGPTHPDTTGMTGQSTPPKGLWNQYGVTSAPVSDLTAKVLEWIGLHLNPITKDGFREKNVVADYSGGLDVTFVRSDNGPAGIAGVHEVDIVVGLQDRPVASLQDLDSALQHAIKQIEQGAADALHLDVLRTA